MAGSLGGTVLSDTGVGIKVAVGGMGETVGAGRKVSVGETTVLAGTHEVKTRAMSKTVLIFLTFINTFFCKELADVVRYQPGWGALPNASPGFPKKSYQSVHHPEDSPTA